MALYVPNVSETVMLERLVKGLAGGAAITTSTQCYQIMKLNINDVTQDETNSLGSFQEATQSGYAAVTLTTSGWTVATDTATYSPAATFTFSTSATVFGYYVVDTATPTPSLLWAESFTGGPFVLPSGGGQIQITPTLTLA